MKVRAVVQAIGLAVILSFSTNSLAEYYVVAGGPPCCVVKHKHKIHKKKHRVKRHYKRHYHYFDWWAWKHRFCYDPDLTTGDDDPCIDPNMNIDH